MCRIADREPLARKGYAGLIVALVGDADYNEDFITAHGIQDAFRDAELCVTAVERRSPVPARSTT